MKFILLSVILMTQGWAGWYGSSERISEAIDAAKKHPLSHSNRAILRDGNPVGSAVVVGPQLVMSAAHVFDSLGPGKSVPKGYTCSGFNNDQDEPSPQVVTAYSFPDQDLAFLELDRPLPQSSVASIIPRTAYQAVVASYQSNNRPRPNEGLPALFFGCGHKISIEHVVAQPKEYVKEVHSYTSPVNRFSLGQSFGELAIGECFLSQHFKENPHQNPEYRTPEAFYAWTSFGNPSPTLTPLLSSALPGDSGGPLVIDYEGSSFCAGVTSQIYVGNNWDQEDKSVGTRFVTPWYHNKKGELESYLDRALEMSTT